MNVGDLEIIKEDIVYGRVVEAGPAVARALERGLPAKDILEQGLLPAMDEVGRRFECEEIYVPEMMASAKAFQEGLHRLRWLLTDSGVAPAGRVVLGTVQGDLHDIGKNLVGLMLEGAGFKVLDLGANVPPMKFVEAVREGADLVGLSALLTTTMTNMPAVLDALQQAGVRERVKVMVGGAPLAQAFADEIGADGYAADASRAVILAKAMMARI